MLIKFFTSIIYIYIFFLNFICNLQNINFPSSGYHAYKSFGHLLGNWDNILRGKYKTKIALVTQFDGIGYFDVLHRIGPFLARTRDFIYKVLSIELKNV